MSSDLFAPLPEGPYQIIYADNPWNYRNQVQRGGKDQAYSSSADAYYPTVSVEDLCKLPVADIADPEGSLLFSWATGPLLEDAMRVMKAWKFQYVQIGFVWEKAGRSNPGHYTMTSCEYLLIGKRKRVPKPRGARNIRQFYQEPRTKHSRKPEEFAHRIEQMFPAQRKIELFARATRAGWDAYGNEVA